MNTGGFLESLGGPMKSSILISYTYTFHITCSSRTIPYRTVSYRIPYRTVCHAISRTVYHSTSHTAVQQYTVRHDGTAAALLPGVYLPDFRDIFEHLKHAFELRQDPASMTVKSHRLLKKMFEYTAKVFRATHIKSRTKPSRHAR